MIYATQLVALYLYSCCSK